MRIREMLCMLAILFAMPAPLLAQVDVDFDQAGNALANAQSADLEAKVRMEQVDIDRQDIADKTADLKKQYDLIKGNLDQIDQLAIETYFDLIANEVIIAQNKRIVAQKHYDAGLGFEDEATGALLWENWSLANRKSIRARLRFERTVIMGTDFVSDAVERAWDSYNAIQALMPPICQ